MGPEPQKNRGPSKARRATAHHKETLGYYEVRAIIKEAIDTFGNDSGNGFRV